ncbi:MAG: hypothetical protein ABSH27_09995 [Solirubrobacteraceae bacterium]
MSDRGGGVSDGLPDLGGLLELLHNAEMPFVTVVASYRVWRHTERAQAAFIAEREAERPGRTVGTVQFARRSDGGEAEESLPETEEVFRIWWAGERFRREQDGGDRDGSYAVRDGKVWWMWDPISGARTNQNDTKVRGVGNEFEIMLSPTVLLGLLRLRVIGRSVVAGRPAINVEALPRPRVEHGMAFELHHVGGGADRYELSVDEQLGVLLNVVALRENEPFREVTTLAIAFDEAIPDERFRFEAPAGEEIHGVLDRPFVRPVPVVEAQRLAPFTVLIPERIPESWQPRCMFFEASDRPPNPPHISLQYRSEDGHESVSIAEMAAADSGPSYDQLKQGDGWQDVTIEGTAIRVTKPGFRGPQRQAHLERDGTFVFLTSETLSGEDLAKIAAGLKPAPTTSSL